MSKRVLIVDSNHLIYKFHYPIANGFYGTDRGSDRVIETIKEMEMALNIDKVIITSDRAIPSRKLYFSKLFGNEIDGYKEHRGDNGEIWKELKEKSIQKMESHYGEIYAKDDYEADDIIKALFDYNKDINELFILCNDADLLPLVNEKTSVLIARGINSDGHTKTGGFKTLNGYLAFNNNNFNDHINEINSYKNNGLTVHTLLLHKMLRGDSSDGIPKLNEATPKLVKSLIQLSIEKNFNFYYSMDLDTLRSQLIELGIKDIEGAIKNYKVMDLNSDFEGLREPYKFQKD